MSAALPTFAQDTTLVAALQEVAARVIARGRYVQDEEVAAFEREFAAYCGAAHCVGVANGTDALELALRAAGVGRGARVATVANAGGYASAAIAAVGAEALYVDIGEDLTLSVDAAQRVLHEAQALIVTHLYGRVAAVARLCEHAARAGVVVIEDCAQAHGATANGRSVGTFGALGAFSFYPTKNLGALGDGGAVITSDAGLAATLRSLRQYGWGDKYRVVRAGGRNSRLDELQAAFLRVKLPHLTRWNAERLVLAERYREGLRGLPLRVPPWREGEYVAHLFVVLCAGRDGLREHLAREGIATDVHYPVGDHLQDVASSPLPHLPLTEAACREVVTLPCFPGMPTAQVDRVIAAIAAYFAHRDD
jgi:dTDP-3-amino-2,3,6-trideoxy-4-keto-D-glucose/dTDP-3-amino-3,4,6-trideoxy-alpha-D-glucose/dTDP-2,6-dideoxy-D-kanosamine transaminase